MDPKIKVDIEELLDILKSMADEEYSTVELQINSTDYFDDYTLSLKAIDISSGEDIDYGVLRCIPDDF